MQQSSNFHPSLALSIKLKRWYFNKFDYIYNAFRCSLSWRMVDNIYGIVCQFVRRIRERENSISDSVWGFPPLTHLQSQSWKHDFSSKNRNFSEYFLRQFLNFVEPEVPRLPLYPTIRVSEQPVHYISQFNHWLNIPFYLDCHQSLSNSFNSQAGLTTLVVLVMCPF